MNSRNQQRSDAALHKRMIAWELHCEGHSLRRIGKSLGVSPGCVCRWLSVIRARLIPICPLRRVELLEESLGILRRTAAILQERVSRGDLEATDRLFSCCQRLYALSGAPAVSFMRADAKTELDRLTARLAKEAAGLR